MATAPRVRRLPGATAVLSVARGELVTGSASVFRDFVFDALASGDARKLEKVLSAALLASLVAQPLSR